MDNPFYTSYNSSKFSKKISAEGSNSDASVPLFVMNSIAIKV